MIMRCYPAIIITTLAFIFFADTALAQNGGEKIFKQTCAACHTVGKGRLVGPDLANVSQRHSEDWIIKFVKSSQTVIKSGDKYADSLYKSFNQTVMPDHPDLNNAQIKDVIAYIQTAGASTTSVSPEVTSGVKTVKPVESLFSTVNLYLFGVIFLMLIVIFHLSKTNKSLVDQIRDFYSSDRSFYKK